MADWHPIENTIIQPSSAQFCLYNTYILYFCSHISSLLATLAWEQDLCQLELYESLQTFLTGHHASIVFDFILIYSESAQVLFWILSQFHWS